MINNPDYEQQRSQKIIDILTPKKINYGQIHTFQIAIPDRDIQTIDQLKRELIEKSFKQLGTNIFPVIVRERDQDDDDEEYEVIYGASWCIIAKELEIKKLWVWIFDLSDEQALMIKSEMEELAGMSQPLVKEVKPITETNQSNDILLQELKFLQNQVKNLTTKLEDLSANSNYLSNNLTTIIKQEVENYLNSTNQPVTQAQPKHPKSSVSQPKKYQDMNLKQLKEIAQKLKIKGRSNLKSKEELIAAIEAHNH